MVDWEGGRIRPTEISIYGFISLGEELENEIGGPHPFLVQVSLPELLPLSFLFFWVSIILPSQQTKKTFRKGRSLVNGWRYFPAKGIKSVKTHPGARSQTRSGSLQSRWVLGMLRKSQA